MLTKKQIQEQISTLEQFLGALNEVIELIHNQTYNPLKYPTPKYKKNTKTPFEYWLGQLREMRRHYEKMVKCWIDILYDYDKEQGNDKKKPRGTDIYFQ